MPNTGKLKRQWLNEFIHSVWTSAKRWRTIWLGPVSLKVRMARTVPVSNDTSRRLVNGVRNFLRRDSSLHPRTDLPVPSAQPPLAAQDAACGRETALIVGAGPGLGFALVRR